MNLDLKYNKEAVCPYCGDVQSETYEAFSRDIEEETTMDCAECGKEFIVIGHKEITYNTYPIAQQEECEKDQ